MSKLAFAFTLLCASQSSVLAQTGRMGTPEEQQACSRDASRGGKGRVALIAD